MTAAAFREITTSLRFPEGPVALPDGSVLVAEMARGTLTRVGADGAQTIVAHLGGGPNGAAIGPDGKCYVCNNGGVRWREDEHGLRPAGQAPDYQGGRIDRVDLATGAVDTLYDACDGRKLCGPNDLVFDAQGGFWFSDAGKTRDRASDRGSVYYAAADGSMIREAIFPMFVPNGVGLSADGRRLYVAETHTARLWAFDLAGPGEIAPKPWPSPHGGELVVGLPGYVFMDSLALDEAGHICVATQMEGGISVISPRGEEIERIPLPDLYASNICFGGDGRRTAFVTLSSTGKLISLPWPRPGLALSFN
ncbi:MAG: gluconolaconase [Rhizobiales bacterium 65-9]|nr:MAG: gluconolaconase [Rhizobiales bacterium 65-9]